MRAREREKAGRGREMMVEIESFRKERVCMCGDWCLCVADVRMGKSIVCMRRSSSKEEAISNWKCVEISGMEGSSIVLQRE